MSPRATGKTPYRVCPKTQAAATSFQRLLEALTHDLPLIVSNLDFLLVHSQSLTDLLEHLKALLRRMQVHGLKAHGLKAHLPCSHFGVYAADFMEHCMGPLWASLEASMSTVFIGPICLTAEKTSSRFWTFEHAFPGFHVLSPQEPHPNRLSLGWRSPSSGFLARLARTL
jgi:hypothetical protein